MGGGGGKGRSEWRGGGRHRIDPKDEGIEFGVGGFKVARSC